MVVFIVGLAITIVAILAVIQIRFDFVSVFLIIWTTIASIIIPRQSGRGLG